MTISGKFDGLLNEYFDSIAGAYTSITEKEISKQTFNVKEVIRDLLVNKYGTENLPGRHPDGRQSILFNIFPDTPAKNINPRQLICKFSKSGKDEMSLYFCKQEFIPKATLHAGDVWFIYFSRNEDKIFWGLLSRANWTDLSLPDHDEREEGNDGNTKTLVYKIDIENLEFEKIDCPLKAPESSEVDKEIARNSKTMLTKNRPVIEENKRRKGQMGERIACEIEKRRLREIGREDLIDKINWVAEKKDGYGYDISSHDVDSEGHVHEIYIEVKTTSGSIKTPFDISLNELNVSSDKKDNYRIYRIYNLQIHSAKVGYYIFKGEINNLRPIPVVYRITPE